MTYPHKMPLGMQDKTSRAGVMLGPTHGASRAPYHLAIGPVRQADCIAALEGDADAMDVMFYNCPIWQWGAAAQAAMSISARQGGEQ